jgi:hypothetical protein
LDPRRGRGAGSDQEAGSRGSALQRVRFWGILGGAGPEPGAGRGRRDDGFGTFQWTAEKTSAVLRFCALAPRSLRSFLLLAFGGGGAVRAAKAKPTEVLFSRERTWLRGLRFGLRRGPSACGMILREHRGRMDLRVSQLDSSPRLPPLLRAHPAEPVPCRRRPPGTLGGARAAGSELRKVPAVQVTPAVPTHRFFLENMQYNLPFSNM